MANKNETDSFLHTKHGENSREKCLSKWWHQKFEHQERICRIIESWSFRAIVILLVILDTGLIIVELMLDSFQIHYECEYLSAHKKLTHEQKKLLHRVEFAMEIAHFVSIGILVFFVFELAVRIYANGREFWNFRRKKMEYFDAFIVITSLIIDLYLLRVEKKLLGRQLLILFSIRLWRFVRIVSSVAEGVRHREKKHKDHLNKQYLTAVNRLVELLKHKTNYLENSETNLDLQSVLEHFRIIDSQCQGSLHELNNNNLLTSSDIVVQFIDGIQGIENKTNESVIETIMIKPTTVQV